MKEQVKSRQRVVDYGEVFTADREVKAMCDLVKREVSRIESRILEPACGDGNFLAEILRRKLAVVKKKYKKNSYDYIRYSLLAVGSMYGIDIQKDNVIICRDRLYKIWEEEYKKVFIEECGAQIRLIANCILNNNIVCGNTLSLRCVNSKGNESKKKLVFYEWTLSVLDEVISQEGDLLVKPKYKIQAEDIAKLQFDVIISNPPYQINDGGNGASAKPIYHLFVEQALKLQPKYITMIIPARWYSGGKGLDKFRDKMLHDRHIRELHDYVDASDCFSGVEIKGGICYFLWERDSEGECKVLSHKGSDIISTMTRPLLEEDNGTFIRYNEAVSILRKVKKIEEETFNFLVSSRKPFGFSSNFRDYKHKSRGKNTVLIYAQKDIGYISKKQVEKNAEIIDCWKVFIPEAVGAGKMKTDVVKPIVAAPNSVCSETYVMVGPVGSKEEANNIASYISTKFFHFLLGLKKISQHTTKNTYSFIPQQDFTISWNDEMLYKKYGLSGQEIMYITASVWPDIN